MDDDSVLIRAAAQSATLGDRLRGIAAELRQETDTQIKATSRILGAAAQMAQNHDQLIGEVVEMVEADLERSEQLEALIPYKAANLKQEFKTLKAAKAHFGLKASSWDALATKLNEANNISVSSEPELSNNAHNQVLERLDGIELKVLALQNTVEQVLALLQERVKQR
ncbi:hypothetical protein PGN35_001765 [Nodosilinea sp. PGN35]|uniref:hypothetical protein n=1 Tax=Nodosilinea sp. PGN35 TaxID=3020489 RepID=UPI0023B294EC|nr:hypothetical protein [Nodosilinea sp. TSF1-S3]MDF0368865.1 hypothetical protein [Nodosilinea sp. TSF1-S3]